MKILLVSGGIIGGGGERVITILANEYCRQGHDVTLLIIDNNHTFSYKIVDGVCVKWLPDFDYSIKDNKTIIRKIQKKIVPFISKKRYKAQQLKREYRRESMKLASFINSFPADIVISKLADVNIIVGLCTDMCSAKTVIIEGTYPLRNTYTDEYLYVRNYAYKKADFCIFQTIYQRELFPYMIKRRGHIIANPLSPDLPLPYVGERRKTVVNISSLKAVKNNELLINAFYLVSQNHPDYSLEIYGDGELREELTKQILELGLEDKVKLFHFCKDVHARVLDCQMFVTTSDLEGLSNSLLEAMAIGLPVIATDCLGGGARAVIENGVNGILVPCGDRHAVAEAIELYINNLEYAKQMSENSVDIRKIYSACNVSKQILDTCMN